MDMSLKIPMGYITDSLLGKIILPTIVAVSVFSNTLIAYVFLGKCQKTCTTVLLAMISITDAINGLSAGVIYGSLYNLYPNKYMPYPLCKLMYITFFPYIFHLASVVLNVFLSLQRFCVVQFPFRGPSCCTMKLTIAAIITAFVVGLVAYIPLLVDVLKNINPLMEPLENTNTSKNTMIVRYENDILQFVPLWLTSLSMDTCVFEFTLETVTNLKFITDYSQIVETAVVFAGIGILVISTTGIIINLWRNKMAQRSKTNNQQVNATKRRTTVMVIAVAVIFVLSQIPPAVQMVCLLKSFEGSFCSLMMTYKETPYLMYTISLHTGALLNIWIYLFMCKDFRMEFLNLVSCRACRN